MRRRLLVGVLGAAVFLDAMLFGALAPLLPHFSRELDLTKGGAGVLVAALGAGLLAGALPASVSATRAGSSRTLVAGLILLAASSAGFGLAENAWQLGLARFVQGISGAATWVGALSWIAATAGRARRGGLIGTVFGAAVFGAIVGPLFGAAAAAVGIRAAFFAVAVAAAVLAVVVLTYDGPPKADVLLGALPRALRDGTFVGALWLSMLPALLFSVLQLLAPLALSGGGFGATGIGLTFFVAGLAEVAVNPLVGRFSDRVGRARPLRIALGVSAAAAIALAAVSTTAALVVLVGVAGVGFGALNTPGLALIADRAEAIQLAPGLAFGAMVLTWGTGNLLGPALGGALADAGGDAVPYLLAAATCLATLVASYAVPEAKPGSRRTA